MNMKQLFSLQNKLNTRIIEEHGLEERALWTKRLLAFLVELGELANETRTFKYWSVKPPSEKKVILEEFVDGLHFILSIGLDLGIEDMDVPPFYFDRRTDTTASFIQIYEKTILLNENREPENYKCLFNSYFQLGQELGYTLEEIEHAYFDKNKVNHIRQDKGY